MYFLHVWGFISLEGVLEWQRSYMYHKNQLPINGFELIDRGDIERAFKLLYMYSMLCTKLGHLMHNGICWLHYTYYCSLLVLFMAYYLSYCDDLNTQILIMHIATHFAH